MMKFLALVLSLGAVAFARPDVSHLPGGHHYHPPHTSYGVPVNHRYESDQHHIHHATGVPSGSYLPGQELPHAHGHVDFLSGGSTLGSGKYEGFNPHLIQDQKHVYYYAAPDDEEQPRLRIHITPNNQKNTNVVFVKAPNYAPAIPEVIAPVSQAEEKTKVFVLVKQPEQPAPISIPAPVSIKSKPEVYVVKYKDEHEAERAISAGNGGHPIGVGVHQLGDEDSFVKILNEDSRLHIPHNDKYSGFDGNIDFFGSRSGVGKDTEGSTLLGSTDHGSHGSGSGSFGISGGSASIGSFGSSVDSSGDGSHESGSFKLDNSNNFGSSSSDEHDSHVSGSVGSHGSGSFVLGSGSSFGSSDSNKDDSHSGGSSGSHVSSSFGLGGRSDFGSSSSSSQKGHSQLSGSVDSFGILGDSNDSEEHSGSEKPDSHGSDSFSGPFGFSSSKSAHGSGSVGVHSGSDNVDAFGSSSVSGSISESSHKHSGDSNDGYKYGPPGASGPY